MTPCGIFEKQKQYLNVIVMLDKKTSKNRRYSFIWLDIFEHHHLGEKMCQVNKCIERLSLFSFSTTFPLA
jgi:hypothetical protein